MQRMRKKLLDTRGKSTMIVTKINKASTKNGNELLLLILEPANLEKLKLGQPIVKNLNQFFPQLPVNIDLMLAWTPDAAWLSEQLLNNKDLIESLSRSLELPEVFIRPYHEAENLTQHQRIEGEEA
jgi:hypothetical protein